MTEAEEIAQALGMEIVPGNGGRFVRTYRSIVKTQATLQRQAGTSFLHLLQGREFFPWHKLRGDEIWMYHRGVPALQFLLFQDGTWEERVVGPDLLAGEIPQSIIPQWTWQATMLLDRSAEAWGLFGTVSVPGFESGDSVDGDAAGLMEKYPGAVPRMRELGFLQV